MVDSVRRCGAFRGVRKHRAAGSWIRGTRSRPAHPRKPTAAARFCHLRYKEEMATFDIINPATSAVLDRAPDATVDDARQAIEKSVTAFASWRAKTGFERSVILRKWYEQILADEDTLAKSMTQEMGKPITESRGEVKYAAAFVE